jgi:5'-nucleotidase
LNLNSPGNRLVEVVLLSRNSANTGLRVMNSIRRHKLDVVRAVFTTGKSPYEYLEVFDTSLFLSADARSVRDAMNNGFAAGRVLACQVKDDPQDEELRIAFDFDGVLAGDESERVYKLKGIKAFHKHEFNKARKPLSPGPLHQLMKKLAHIQKVKATEHPRSGMQIRTAIITARSAPAHHRLIATLRSWGFDVNEAHFLGGMEKARCLAAFKPHIFFDDQARHLSSAAPSVHVPFGISNT